MTPIKWNGSAWVDTTESDTNWYNYDTTNKIWANARTADGSMWVWIPRYAYKFTSGYHSGTAGAICIKFLKNKTNVSSDGTTVVESYDSANNYVKHPAFTFGGSEITGIWIAKFEASNATNAINFKPGAVAIGSLTVGSMFTSVRQMESNNRYGWPLASGLNTNSGVYAVDSNNLDVHMMRNKEWGAVAYLSMSTYGKNSRINTNSSSTFITGGGTGTAYTTNLTQSASGTIYGIYDISGGSWEFVMANYNNAAGSSGLTPSSINNRYIDRYSTTSSGYSTAMYGDAIYETSYNPYIGTTGNNYGSWHENYAIMIDDTRPWFGRGDFYNNSSRSGAFTFNRFTGASDYSASFRAVIVVGNGL
jgi:hypothetical protein